jgi:membrane-associated phospholipid phosphatase
MKQGHLKQWGIAFVAMVLAVGAAYAWLDRPIAFYANTHFEKKPWFDGLTHIPDVLWALAILMFAIAGVYALMGRVLPGPFAVGTLAGVNLVVTEAIKEKLKYVFGRTWPETWVQNNPSLIRDGVYGFNPFHGGQGYASFPSGHTAATCAAMSVLWICCPKLRALFAALVAALVIGLLGADYHFLSDTIAGGFLGCLTGWIAVELSGIKRAPSLPKPASD